MAGSTSRLAAISTLALLLSVGGVHASPIHSHCDIIPWSRAMVVPVVFPAPGLPIENPNNVIAVVSLSGDTPVSNKPNCFYELSDVGRITITMTITAPGAGSGQIDFLGMSANGIGTSTLGPYTFKDTFGLAFFFPRHATAAGDVHISFPGATLSLALIGGSSAQGTILDGIKVSASGSHYFLAPVPEPGTVLLLLFGLALIICRWSRRRRRVSEGEVFQLECGSQFEGCRGAHGGHVKGAERHCFSTARSWLPVAFGKPCLAASLWYLLLPNSMILPLERSLPPAT